MMNSSINLHIKIKKNYNWLWIKYVTGFRSNTHCMNSLVGGRSEIIPPRSKKEVKHPYLPNQTYQGTLDEHKFKYIYLCGVTENYDDNLHVVVKYKPGSIVKHVDKYCEVTLTNCERVPIPKISDSIDRGYQFTTCRNFQMGYAYLRHTDPYDGLSAQEAGIFVKNNTKMVERTRTQIKERKFKNRLRIVYKK